MNKFKGFCFGVSCLVLVSVSACTSVVITSSPYIYSNSESTKFEILGEIVYERAERASQFEVLGQNIYGSGQSAGYIGLLKAARDLYPDCDYVIDIMADRRIVETTKTFFSLQSVNTDVTWVMRGTAIKYIR